MKFELNKKVLLNMEFTLDSSETIMFTKGGRFYQKINLNDILYENVPIEHYEVNVSFHINPEDKSRYDFITKEADEHRAREFYNRKDLDKNTHEN